MALEKRPVYRFGPYTLDPERRRLERAGEEVHLPARGFDTLVVLVENHGRVVPKEELIRSVWHDAFVEENNLNQAVSALRKTLRNGDQSGNGHGRFIETVPRRGYSFVAEVVEMAPAAPAAVAETNPSARFERSHAPLPPRRRPRPTILLALALVAGLAALWLGRSATRTPAAPVRSIAVLPFLPILPGTTSEYLGVALADAVITRLGRVDRLSVRPTAAIQGFDSPERDPLAAGRALRVDAVLDGRIQEANGRMRITVQLLRMGSGNPVWSESFDAPRSDLFLMEDAVADAVVAALGSGIQHGGAARSPARPPAAAANEAYLRGRYEWNKRTPEALLQSQKTFREALDTDPGFAPAWAGLADAHNLVGEPREARAAAERALALDPDLAEAHASLGMVALFHEYDFGGAERRFRRAVSLNPSYATAYQWNAYGLAATGRFDEALAEIRRARDLDPLSASIATDVADILYFAGRYEDARRELAAVLERHGAFPQVRNVLANVLLARGDLDGAVHELRPLAGHPTLAIADARLGRPERARAYVESQKAEPTSFVSLARVQVALEDPSGALDALEAAYTNREGDLAMMGVDPLLAPLREEARFHALLARLGLTP